VIHLEANRRIVRIVLTGVIFFLFGLMFVPFLTPLLMAALFAFALDGIVSRWGLKGSKRKAPTAVILTGFFFLVSFPVTLVAFRIFALAKELSETRMESTSFYQSLEKIVFSVSVKIESIFHSLNATPPEGGLMQYLPKAGSWVLSYVGNLASSAPELVIQLFVFSAALYFFLTESRFIRATVSSFKILSEQEVNSILRVVKRSSYTALVVTAGIGAIQAMIVAFGGLIFGYKEFFLIFVITFFTSFIPVIGAAPIAFLLSAISFIQGDIFSGVGLLIVALVAGSVDNIIKPLIVASSSEESLNPVISLLAIIGAVIVYGLPGILLGPILTELTLKIVPILFSEEEESGQV
jgi:predicted PurR-regulated permease PerM